MHPHEKISNDTQENLHARKLRFAVARCIEDEYREAGAEQRVLEDSDYPTTFFSTIQQRLETGPHSHLIRSEKRSRDIDSAMTILDEGMRDVNAIAQCLYPQCSSFEELYRSIQHNMNAIRALAGNSEESLEFVLRTGIHAVHSEAPDSENGAVNLLYKQPQSTREGRGCPYRNKDVFEELVKAATLRIMYYKCRDQYTAFLDALRQKNASLGSHAIDHTQQ